MTGITIIFEEHGFPVELIGRRDVERAIAAGRLRADTIVRLPRLDGPARTCRARDAAVLQPMLGIDPAAVAPPPPLPSSPSLPPTVVRRLTKGGNVALAALMPALDRVRIACTAAGVEVDVSAFLLAANGRVRSDADLIFYNNEAGDGGAIRLVAAGAFVVSLPDLAVDVQRIAFVTSIYDAEAQGRSFAAADGASVALCNDMTGTELARYDFAEPGAAETALILGELYRHATGWKLRAVGQGYAGGLAALADRFGVDVA